MKEIKYWGLYFLLLNIGIIIMILNKIPAGWINDGINVIICLILNQIIWNKIKRNKYEKSNHRINPPYNRIYKL